MGIRYRGLRRDWGRFRVSPGKVALLVAVAAAAQGIVAFGFAGSASATTTPSIWTTQQPSAATVGSSIADQATVSGYVPGTPTCPATDTYGDGLGTSLTNGPYLFCSYPVYPTEPPDGNYCEYDPASLQLRLDKDGGDCPKDATSVGGGGPTGTVTFNLYDNPNGTGTPLFTDTEGVSGGSATSAGYTATATGTDYWVATYNGDSNFDAVSTGNGDEPVTVTIATPSVSTTASSGSVTVGQGVWDQASVTGGDNPTGTVTFNLYSNDNCTGPALFSDTEGLSSGSATSANYTTTASGTDYWVAFYNGDTNNNTVSSACSAEQVLVNPATLSVSTISTTQMPSSATVGSSIADKATVSGSTGTTYSCPPQDLAGFPLGDNSVTVTMLFCSYPATPGENPYDYYCEYGTGTGLLTVDNDNGLCQPTAVATGPASPTGTVTFNLYDNPNGTGTPLFTDTESVSGSSATSAGYTATATGTDYWVATYNGDSNFDAVSSGNGDEPVLVTPAGPSVSTTASASTVKVGRTIADKASVTGGFNPSGTVTFNLYSNDSCTGPALFSDTESLSGGSATSTIYRTTSTGTDYWVATYNGDANNNSTSSSCSGELVTVNRATPTVSAYGMDSNTRARPGRVTYTVWVKGRAGIPPTGSVTVSDGTQTCNITALSDRHGQCSIVETASGTYSITASYGGDSNYVPASATFTETIN